MVDLRRTSRTVADCRAVEPVQLYETTIYDGDTGQSVRFVTVPTRSLVRLPPDATPQSFTTALSAEQATWHTTPVEAWNLPFMIDFALGRSDFALVMEQPGEAARPSTFAQYVSYAPVVPIEQSPLAARSLAELVGAVATTTAFSWWYSEASPVFVLYVGGTLIVLGAAAGIAEALRVGLRARLLRLMGVEIREPPPDER